MPLILKHGREGFKFAADLMRRDPPTSLELKRMLARMRRELLLDGDIDSELRDFILNLIDSEHIAVRETLKHLLKTTP